MRRWTERFPAIALALLMAGLVCGPSAFARAASGHWQVFGGAAHRPTLFVPTGLALDNQQNVYVADSGNFRIVKLSPSGRVLARFGRRGDGPGEFAPIGGDASLYLQGPIGPDDLAIDRSGRVFVADPGNRRIDVFTSAGRFLTAWNLPLSPTATGPLALTVGPSGNVIVAFAAQVDCNPPSGEYCATYYVVQHRRANGTVSGEWQSATPVRTPQSDANGIQHIALAVDGAGTIYVATTGTLLCYKSCPSFGFLEKWTPNGRLLRRWGGFSLGIPWSPIALSIGGRNNLFVADTGAERIEKRSPTGMVLRRFVHVSPGFLGTVSPAGVAVDRRGAIYATDTARGAILKFSPAGGELDSWGASGSAPGLLLRPTAVALGPGGILYVYDSGNNRIVKFSAHGAFRGVLHLANLTNPGTLGAYGVGASALAVDRAGNLYVGERIHDGISIGKFSPGGRLVARYGAGMHMAAPPTGLAIDSAGDIIAVADFAFPYVRGAPIPRGGSMILKLSPSGRQLALIRPPYAVSPVQNIAVDAAGNMYLSEGPEPLVHKLSPQGAALTTFGNPEPRRSYYPIPTGIGLDGQGNIYVLSAATDRIDEYAPNGTPLGHWGGAGSDPGQFHLPSGLAVGSGGSLSVADTGNQRVQSLQR